MSDTVAHASISVRLTPRASKDEIVGWQDGQLRVRLRAPPVEGQANEALRRFLAKRLNVPSSAVEIVSGGSARRKRLKVLGLAEDDVKERLAKV